MTTPFTIYVMQSAHTDIGYTHPQEQIALMYLDHYDRVLDLCRDSADAPAAHRFKWVCETSWQVRHYLQHRPEREAEFLAYVRSGQIEITATYLHFTDLIDADAYRRSLEWVIGYCRDHDLPLRSALHCDINGWPWALPDIFADADIPFFCSHVHLDSGTDPLGRRGSLHYGWLIDGPPGIRRDAPVRIPQAFWWEGPDGGRVLHWLNEHYHLGNLLGLSSSHPFYADKTRYFLETDRMTPDSIYEVAQREVPRYVERLREEQYPYDALLVSTGGFFVDNSPPDGRWCDVIERWNAEHDDIKLRTATVGEWYEYLRERDTGDWPVYAVAWPDHWAHGLGSETARIAQARQTQRRRADVIDLVEKAAVPAAERYLALALEQERLALEHTFNAWSTSAIPASPLNDFQQKAKALTFHRAEMYLDEATGAALRGIAEHQPEQELYVNVRQPNASGRLVHFPASDLTLDPTAQTLEDRDGNVVPFQREQHDLTRYVAHLPAAETGVTRLRIRQQAASASPAADTHTLASDGWTLAVDPQTGGLSSLRDASGREWVTPTSDHAFGQLVHEAVVHPLGREATHNSARFVALDVADDDLRRRMGDQQVYDHTSPRIDGTPTRTSGPVFDAIEMLGSAPRIGTVRISWRVYHALPLVELALDWVKTWSDLPEAAYVAFPFADGERVELETGGGFFEPGSHERGGQLPGTCSSYYTIQRAGARSQCRGRGVAVVAARRAVGHDQRHRLQSLGNRAVSLERIAGVDARQPLLAHQLRHQPARTDPATLPHHAIGGDG